MPQALKTLCLIHFWSWENALISLLALWGNRNWPSSIKVRQMENCWNKMGLKGWKWSSLNTPGTQTFFHTHFWPRRIRVPYRFHYALLFGFQGSLIINVALLLCIAYPSAGSNRLTTRKRPLALFTNMLRFGSLVRWDLQNEGLKDEAFAVNNLGLAFSCI